MLFDPKWNKPSLDSLIAWLGTKNATETYNYHNPCGDCLFGQYMKTIGVKWGDLSQTWDSPYGKTVVAIAGHRNDSIAMQSPHTFGAALERAKAFKAKQSA